jgi:hypothetical protein
MLVKLTSTKNSKGNFYIYKKKCQVELKSILCANMQGGHFESRLFLEYFIYNDTIASAHKKSHSVSISILSLGWSMINGITPSP